MLNTFQDANIVRSLQILRCQRDRVMPLPRFVATTVRAAKWFSFPPAASNPARIFASSLSSSTGFNQVLHFQSLAVACNAFRRRHPYQAIPTDDTLEGVIQRVTYANEESGWCVLKIRVEGVAEARTVTGHASGVTSGQFVTAQGEWVRDANFGLQLRAESISLSSPVTVGGMAKYLGSGLVKGIGAVYGKRLVETFGEHVFEVIEHHPHRLTEVKGIGAGRQKKIAQAWKEQAAIRELMIYLHGLGVGGTHAQRIYKAYGNQAIAVVSANPFRLSLDIRGIGFKTADAVAGAQGMQKDAPQRVRAGVRHALSECTAQGHCGLPRHLLVRAAVQVLEVDDSLVEEALEVELKSTSLVRTTVGDQECIFLAPLFRMEQRIADSLVRMAAGPPPWPEVDCPAAIEWVEEKVGIRLGESQREALRMALTSKVLVVTGGPGVGKTTLLRSVLQILSARGVRSLLTAPTGRAAKRLSESTGMPASTIHRLLGCGTDGDTEAFAKSHSGNQLECDLLVVDEASMVDVRLMHALMQAAPPSAALILVGDVDQLPSVGPGQVLGDVIASAAVEVVALTEVFRQAQGSSIVANAHRINRGQSLELAQHEEGTDFYVWKVKDVASAENAVVDLLANRIPNKFGFDPVQDVQVLTPRNSGSAGTANLNNRLQDVLNPAKAGSPSVQRFNYSFRPGDKVMATVNDHDREVYNGDLGKVESIDEVDQEMVIRFDDKLKTFDFSDLDSITLAYATTIHKSQGSEFPVVVMPLTMQAYMMLQRNLLYTGVTRGKQLVVLVAEEKALRMAISNVNVAPRWSKLKDLLQEASRSGGNVRSLLDC